MLNATSYRGNFLLQLGALLATCGCTVSPPVDQLPATVPVFRASAFTDSLNIDNPYFPLVAGTTWTYSAESADRVERTVVEVLAETRTVAGVECRVVRDRVYLNDILIEDTYDWYAQDDDGNVWYMGEEVDNYDYDDTGALIDVTHEGAWEAGADPRETGSSAHPGFQMVAAPASGDVYHQEYYAGEAEDMGEVVAVEVPVTLANGSTYVCVQTLDTNPLDPGHEEYKYYAPGVGLVLEETVDGGERVELESVE